MSLEGYQYHPYCINYATSLWILDYAAVAGPAGPVAVNDAELDDAAVAEIEEDDDDDSSEEVSEVAVGGGRGGGNILKSIQTW